MSPERERSFADARGYGSDSEALGGLARSQSILHPAHDPLMDSYGDIYSPLRSGIRPGSFTFASLNELGMCQSDTSQRQPLVATSARLKSAYQNVCFEISERIESLSQRQVGGIRIDHR